MQRPSDSLLFEAPTAGVFRQGAVLDGLLEESFDRLTRIAAHALHAPLAVMSLVEGEREILRSSFGLPDRDAGDAPVPHVTQLVAASAHAVSFRDEREEEAARIDDGLRELGVLSLAGVPLRQGDQSLGSLVVMDRVPREWTQLELDLLGDLAGVAVREIAQRLDLHSRKIEELRDTIGQFRTLVEHSLAGIYVIQDGRFIYVNPKLAEMFGYTDEEIVSSKVPADLVATEDWPAVEENIDRRLRGEIDSVHHGFRGITRDGRTLEVEVLGSRTAIGGRPAVIGMLLDVTDRKRSEEALRRREEHFRSLLENAWDGIHEIGVDGKVRYISPSAERMLGYDRKEMLGRSLLELVHPDDAGNAEGCLEKAMKQPGTVRCFKIRLRRKDDEWRTVEVQMTVVNGSDQEPLAIINTRDVTEAEQVEQALRESEERYRLVAHATNSAIREWEIRSGRCIWTAASGTLLRYTDEEIGSSVDWWYERIQPEHREQVINSIQAVLDGVGDAWSQEYGFLRGDGVYATVLDCCHISRNERGIPIRVVGSLVDVTERRRSEEAQRFLARASTLLGEELNLETTLTSLARLTVPTLADYCLIDLVEKREGRGMLRRVALAHVDPSQEARLRKNEFHTLDADPERHPVIRVIRTKEPVLVTECTEKVLRDISHDEEHYRQLVDMGLRSFMIVPLVAHGHILGVITLAAAKSTRRLGPRDLLVAENLAHRAALVIEHAQLYKDAQKAIRAREEVLGVVSHDLRNPLNIIHLSSALMLESVDEQPPDTVQSLHRIQRASAQMAGMIEDLLDMYTIDGGRFSILRSRQAVAPLLREVCDQLKPLAEQESVEIACEIDGDIPDLDIDSGQIVRVFSNLIGNAIKFTPPEGTITVRASHVEDAVRFSIADTGPGIPDGQLPYVFDRYWQARYGDRRGVGLGLAIAKGIVEAHGGTIRVRNGEEGGAIFCFSIPVHPPR